MYEARIYYHNGKTQLKKEGFEIRIKGADGLWGMDKFFPLYCLNGQDENNFIHFSVLTHLDNLRALGYKVNLNIYKAE